MERLIFILSLIIMIPVLGQSQELYRISFDNHQVLENGGISIEKEIELPTTSNTIVLGGLNELQTMGSYFNVYGTKLIIDSLDQYSDGTKRVVLRREDGRNFYNLFSTLSAKLVPMTLIEKEELVGE